jgi:hypothetical protein
VTRRPTRRASRRLSSRGRPTHAGLGITSSRSMTSQAGWVKGAGNRGGHGGNVGHAHAAATAMCAGQHSRSWAVAAKFLEALIPSPRRHCCVCLYVLRCSPYTPLQWNFWFSHAGRARSMPALAASVHAVCLMPCHAMLCFVLMPFCCCCCC